MEFKKNNDSRRGAILLAAVLVAIAIAVIVGAYLKLATKELELADSGFMYNSLLNQAESGTSDLQAVVYSPNANLTIDGSNSTSGSVVANQITLSGTPDFHYDEALDNFFDGGESLQMTSWRELIDASEKVDIASHFD